MRRTWVVVGAVAAAVSAGLMFLSADKPWLFQIGREPWAVAGVGSGRVKVLWSRAGTDERERWGWWPAMYYRGLDGRPIRWDVSVGWWNVRVLALPLWPVVVGSAAVAGAALWKRRRGEGECAGCGYDARGLAVCPECGRLRARRTTAPRKRRPKG